jgi:hypothetical protein
MTVLRLTHLWAHHMYGSVSALALPSSQPSASRSLQDCSDRASHLLSSVPQRTAPGLYGALPAPLRHCGCRVGANKVNGRTSWCGFRAIGGKLRGVSRLEGEGVRDAKKHLGAMPKQTPEWHCSETIILHRTPSPSKTMRPCEVLPRPNPSVLTDGLRRSTQGSRPSS